MTVTSATGQAPWPGPAPLVGHDEGAAHVAVLHQALPVGQAQLGAHLDGCRAGAVRDRHHAVDAPPRLPAQAPPGSASCVGGQGWMEKSQLQPRKNQGVFLYTLSDGLILSLRF